MANNNAIAGMKCPTCGNEGEFLITATANVTVVDHGVIDVQNFEWSDFDNCSCSKCNHGGVVGDFKDE